MLRANNGLEFLGSVFVEWHRPAGVGGIGASASGIIGAYQIYAPDPGYRRHATREILRYAA